MREPLPVLDGKLHVKMANRSFYDLFRVKPAATEDRFIYKLGDGEWDLPELRELLENVLPARTTLEDFPFEPKFSGVGWKKLLLNARRLVNPDNGTDGILPAMQDANGRK
jgi:hypothetical protein